MNVRAPAGEFTHIRDDDPSPVARRVVILCNPASGRGKAVATARQCAAALSRDGHHVTAIDVRRDRPTALEEALMGAEILVVAGGDGTVHRALPAAMACGVAVHHLPFGTENLFAREFGMTRDVEGVARAVRVGAVREVDVGMCVFGEANMGTPFALFTGAGFDAEVVHRLDQGTRGTITKWSYVKPILAAARAFDPPRWTVSVDGVVVADGVRGALFVANSRRYGGRLDPAPGASMVDGILDVVLFPARGLTSLVLWAAACRARQHLRMCGSGCVISARGQQIDVHAQGRPFPIQCDGEPTEVRVEALSIEVRPSSLRVLPPAQRG